MQTRPKHFTSRWRQNCCASALYVLLTFSAAGAVNVVTNGSFSDKTEPLRGWNTDYRWNGNSAYANNYRFVDVIPKEGRHRSVMRLRVSQAVAERQGVMVDSDPIPFEAGSSYRLRVDARTTGPNCRIYLEGYKRKRGVKKSEKPLISDLHKVFRQAAGRIVYFGGSKSGISSNPLKTWSTGKAESFPPSGLSALGEAHIQRIEYLVVHIVGILGSEGEVFIDNVELKKN